MKQTKLRIPINWGMYDKSQQKVIQAIFKNDGIKYTNTYYEADFDYMYNMAEWCDNTYPANVIHYAKYLQNNSGISIKEFTPFTVDLELLVILVKFSQCGLDKAEMLNYLNNNINVFTPNQLTQIFMGLLSGVNIDVYAKEEYEPVEMENIRRNLEDNTGRFHAEILIAMR